MALAFAVQVSPVGSRNLVAPNESYKDVMRGIARPAREVLHDHNLKGFHEPRAALACERYEQITQHRAPINGGRCYAMDSRLDRGLRSRSAKSWGMAGLM